MQNSCMNLFIIILLISVFIYFLSYNCNKENFVAYNIPRCIDNNGTIPQGYQACTTEINTYKDNGDSCPNGTLNCMPQKVSSSQTNQYKCINKLKINPDPSTGIPWCK